MVIQALINANTAAGARVFGWADYPTRPELFPLVLVSVPREHKASIFPGTLQFNTTFTVVVIARLTGALPTEVGIGMENLGEQITDALCIDPVLGPYVQQYNSIESLTVLSADGKQHIGELSMTFEVILYQQYGPLGVPLTDILSTGTVVADPTDTGTTSQPTIIFDTTFTQST